MTRRSLSNHRKTLLIFLLSVVAFLFFFVYLPYTRIKTKAKEVSASAKELKATFSQNDISLLKTKLDDFSSKYSQFEKESQSVYWMSFIPYVADYKNGVEAGTYLVDAAKQAVAAISPYADLIGFKKGHSSFVEQSAQDRLQTAVLTLDKVLGRIDGISADIKQAEDRISQIDPNRYPKMIGKTVVKDKIVNLKEQFYGLSTLFVDAKPLLKNLPTMLGKDHEKNYLILFQDDKERRATGGFLTSYAVFKVKDGKISISNSEDIYSLDASISNHPVAPKEILTYHLKVPQFNIRDSNLSPDFVKSIDLFNSLYKNSSQKVKYDGLVAIDSNVLVDMLKIYGDTEVDGIVFSAKNTPQCDCPQVLYRLFDLVDRPVNYVKENRKGILGDLMYAIFYKALGFSPSKYWGTLAQTMYQNLQYKHILLYFVDPQLEDAADKIDFAGRIKDFNGDYLHINNVNFAGAKSNLFVNETVDSKTTFNSSGTISREVVITYRNPYPGSDCNLERGGLCLNAMLRNWIRVYLPKGSKLVDFRGSSTSVNTYDDLNKTVFEGFLTVVPKGKAEVDVKYTLPNSISTNNYQLMIQRQAGADTTTLQAEINNRQVFNQPFLTDVVLKNQ